MSHIYSGYDRQYLAVECIILGYDISEKEPKLLLIKRSFETAL